MSLVRIEAVQPHVQVITMTDQERRNTLSTQMLAALEDALREAEHAGCRAVIVRAEPGSSTWCAGFDITALPEQVPAEWDHPMDSLLDQVARAPFPVIAAVEGGVWGGGCELVLACDLVVAVRTATFAITPTRLGVAYGTSGIARFLAALPATVVNEMFFMAEPVDAERLSACGMVNRLTDDAAGMEQAAQSLAETIAKRAPLTVQSVKAEIRALTAAHIPGGQDEALAALRRQAWDSADYQEGLRAFREKRSPMFRGE